jgi:hypothetical protein
MMKRVSAAALLLGLLLPASAGAVIAREGKYAGPTSQTTANGTHLGVDIKLTDFGLTLKRFEIAWTAACDSGFIPLVQSTRAVDGVVLDGKFHGGGTYKSSSGNLAGTQYSAQVTSKLKAKFVVPRKVKGTFKVTAVLIDTTTGAPVSTCTTPTIHWHAKHL